jgi:hypothetical protein
MGSYAISVEGSMAGQVVINSLGFRIVGSTGFETPGEALELATNIRTAWQARMLARMVPAYAFVGVTARGVTEPGIAEFASATVTPGTNGGSPLPSFVAIKFKFRTATPGRAGRGRTGLAGASEDSTTAGAPNRIGPADVTANELAWANFRADLLAGSQPAEQVVISTMLGGVPRAAPLVSLVTSVQVDGELGTRVSRLR